MLRSNGNNNGLNTRSLDYVYYEYDFEKGQIL